MSKSQNERPPIVTIDGVEGNAPSSGYPNATQEKPGLSDPIGDRSGYSDFSPSGTKESLERLAAVEGRRKEKEANWPK